LRQG